MINVRKTRIMRAHRQQKLAGLVVNAGAQVPRSEYDALRALLFNCVRFGPDSQNMQGRSDFRSHLRGRIAWVGQTSTRRRDVLLALESRIDWAHG
ncbi:RNA-directed DNA polymerase [Rhodococcus rhodnii]|uniref:RNA-directed DNA polymerase n=1 Tax=Rhodococcus rhodnii TaxID=38312 RepID=UPI0003A34924|nr:RNA-directed DNA polymerase [Rhodococcus rhodnii]